jgi:hypothetical protein
VGVVPTAVGPGVTGILSGALAPAAIGLGSVQVTVLPLVVQVQAPLVKLAGAVMPVGSGKVTVVGPVVGPLPMLVTVIGKALVTPSFKAGEGWPIVVVTSGLPSTVAVVTGVEVLLAGLLSFTVLTVLVRIGVVPTAVSPGVIGMLSVLLVPELIGPGSVQVTVLPLVVHVHGPLVKLAGAVMPGGRGTVTVTGPLAAGPLLVTVTGTLLVTPSWNTGEGCPIVTDKSDAVQSAVIVV